MAKIWHKVQENGTKNIRLAKVVAKEKKILRKPCHLWAFSSGMLPSPKVIKLFSCSAQLRLKFSLLINVKMPTVIGILTFISRINYCLMGFIQDFSTDLGYFSINELLKFHAQLSC